MIFVTFTFYLLILTSEINRKCSTFP